MDVTTKEDSTGLKGFFFLIFKDLKEIFSEDDLHCYDFAKLNFSFLLLAL